ncbi:MAG: molybdenum cofactor guanylyltransferase, partial [Polyangiaceae bacterium]
GIFVGGASRRMGQAKGLLRSPEGPSLIDRTAGLFDAIGVPWVLVGLREEYAPLGYPALADDVPDTGPLGGLVTLLRHARDGFAIAIACDMPYLSGALLERLIAAPHGAPIISARRHHWEPLFARYDAPAVLPLALASAARGERSLQKLLDAAAAEALVLAPDEAAQLDDWDTPLDVAAEGRVAR